MGREIKRVVAYFDWPLNKIWKGYVNPHYKKCPDCENGQTPSRDAFDRFIQLFDLAVQDSRVRPRDFKPPTREFRGTEYPIAETRKMEIEGRRRNYPHPSVCNAGIMDVGNSLWEIARGLVPDYRFGPLGGDRYQLELMILKAAGLSKDWGICPTCKGRAIDPAVFETYEAWESEEPPAGEWWQLWETVSEGSPISPPFATADELIDYMSQPSSGEMPWDQGYSREAAEHFVKGSGWAPSGVFTPETGFVDGVTGMAVMAKMRSQ